jgi:membrane protein YqaA with SNARE-associated domain
MSLASHPRAVWGLGCISFIESSIFPIPPDALLLPMALAKRQRAFFYAFICTLTSVLGGILGYAIGVFLYSSVGASIIEFYGLNDAFNSFKDIYKEWGIWIVLAAGFTPFPYKVITIASGVVGLNFPLFMLASITARAMRFYLVATLIWYFGEPIRTFIEKNLGMLAILFFLLLFGGFMIIKMFN